ncbi:hypothetical protein L6R49_26705, partial [Myxococcota bacterium]|nr:hypothetical protein [Myxococcota bacterium]
SPVSARDKTYCVGGYDGVPPRHSAACNTRSVRSMHKLWHAHMFVTNGRECMECYDEQDSSCEWDFLQNNPGWRHSDPFTCRNLGSLKDGQYVHQHLIDGAAATPSPPKPVTYRAALDSVSPGPYAVGDQITLVGSLRDDAGNPRPTPGGDFVFTGADGRTFTIAGTPQRDGTVTAQVKLQAIDGLKVEFRPKLPSLAAHEKVVQSASSATPIEIELCEARAQVISPTAGEPLLSGQPTLLRATLLHPKTNQPISVPGASLEFDVRPDGLPATKVAANGSLEARYTPPASADPRDIRLSVSGRVGERAICPAPEVVVSASDSGLAFDLSELPERCYVGLPCVGDLSLRLPPEGTAARQRADRLLADPKVSLRITDNSAVVGVASAAKGAARLTRQYDKPGNADWQVVLLDGAGVELLRSAAHTVTVRPPLQLRLPDRLDFGTIPAGSPIEEVCQTLDFSASQAAEEHGFRVEWVNGAGCASSPRLMFLGALGFVDTASLTPHQDIVSLDPDQPNLTVCLDVPRCDADASPSGTALRVTPLTPEFGSQATTVRLTWDVTGRSWLSCNLWWVAPSAGVTGLLLLLYGFIRPARFSEGAAARVADEVKNLRRVHALVLREQPGSGAGFYRDARVGVHADGTIDGRLRQALVELRAEKGGGVLMFPLNGSVIEVQDHRTKRFEPISVPKEGYSPGNALYRVGPIVLKVEAS